MDEDLLLINELVDSDDDIGMQADLFFNELHPQLSLNLLEILHPQLDPEDAEIHTTLNDLVSNEGLQFDSLTANVQTLTCTGTSKNNAIQLSEEDFLKLFRVEQPLVEFLKTTLTEKRSSHADPLEVLKVPPDIQILSVLFFLGQIDVTIEDVCGRFNLSESSFGHILNKVSVTLCDLSSKEIHLPDTREKEITKTFYSENIGIQGVIGCIHTLPVNVTPSKDNTASRELCVIQAIVNENAKFSHVYVSKTAEGDEDILCMSSVYEALPFICSGNEYFLGGDTYPCLQHLLTPYLEDEQLSGDKIYFNLRVAACMQTADTAFSLLIQRFPKLVNFKLPDVAISSQLLTACCVIHNMASNDDIERLEEPPIVRNDISDECSRNSQPFKNTCSQGQKRRDDVCLELMEN